MGTFLKYFSQKHQELLLILSITTVLRVLLASSLELGNDEAYYWTYVKYPDISHFDHPPMLGYLAQLFTFNLRWDSELAIRLSSVFCGMLGTLLIYFTALEIRNKRAAIYAALLFSSSLYTSIISSIFLMPDNPLVVCWLYALYLMVKLFQKKELNQKQILLLGIAIGLAILSKYQGVFLSIGFVISCFFHRRKWLTKPSFYIAFSLSFLIASPILWWNLEHNFVSLDFHGSRIGLFDKGIRLDYFFSEILGEICYNNPINVALIVVALVQLKNKKWKLKNRFHSLFLNTSWPLLLLVLLFSLFRKTLPHWTGPAYLSLMLLAALYLSRIKMSEARKWLIPALSFAFLVSQLGALEINQGVLTNAFSNPKKEREKVGKYDVTLDMYAWRQFKSEFERIPFEESDIHLEETVLVSQDLYQSAHLDYYLAQPLQMKLIAFGSIKEIHKYAWINAERGYLKTGQSALFVTHSRAFKSAELFLPYFNEVKELKVIPIYRNGHLAENFFVFRLGGYKGNYPFPEVKY